ncbi:MAG: hypothetical protein ACK4IT_04505 [Thioalkalivibrionaceae bacterium]
MDALTGIRHEIDGDCCRFSGDGFRVDFDHVRRRAVFEGALRRNGPAEYEVFWRELERMVARGGHCWIDLQLLEFLNSSGIAMLSRLVLRARDTDGLSVTIRGSRQIPWQARTLRNLSKLWPELVVLSHDGDATAAGDTGADHTGAVSGREFSADR